jgi:hypothetical protein
MTETSYPFASGAGATVGETEWQRMARAFLATGVIDDQLNELAVSADGSALQVSVATGEAWVEGFFYRSDAVKTIDIATADPTNPRIDTIVVRLDRVADAVTTEVVEGIPAADPAAPTLSQTDDLYELAIADVAVPAASGVIRLEDVTDRRVFSRNLSERAGNAAYDAKTYRTLVQHSVAQPIPTATDTTLTFNAESWDEGGYYDTAAPTRLTIPAATASKRHRLKIRGSFAANNTGRRFIRVRRDGVSVWLHEVAVVTTGGETSYYYEHDDIARAAGTYYEVAAYQSSGGNLDVAALARFQIETIG